MKIISVWQPFASLTVHGHKGVETEGWAAPKSLIGETIGVASTKQIKPEQRATMQDPEFARHYAATGLPELEELPHGAILGTALLHSCDVITAEDLEDVTDEELSFGWWEVGRYAWRLRYPKVFDQPVFTRGAQGIWVWNDEAEIEKDTKALQWEGLRGRAGVEP